MDCLADRMFVVALPRARCERSLERHGERQGKHKENTQDFRQHKGILP